MGYHGDVRLWRVIAILLVLGVGAGPVLLDPCLAGCHAPSAQAAVPACHESVETPGASLASTAGCGHDHTAMDADSPLESRLTSARQAVQPLDLPEVIPSQPLFAGTLVASRPAATRHPHVPLRPQLRV